MDSSETYQRIARFLQEQLAQGLPLTPAFRHYAESTLGSASFENLAAVVADEDHCEREPLLDLLLFPDAVFKTKLETLLPDTDAQRTFPARLLEDFHADPLQSGLIFPDSGRSIRFRLAPGLAQRFIIRLHLETLIDPRIREAVDAFGPETGALLRVRLRSVQSALPERSVALVCNFCRRFPAPEAVFYDHFDLLLDLLESIGLEQDPYAELMARKRLTHLMLKQAQDFERKLQREPIEALMLRGERCPSIDTEAAERRIAQIDRISMSLFGRTEDIPEEIDLDHGNFNPNHEMDSLFKLFQKE